VLRYVALCCVLLYSGVSPSLQREAHHVDGEQHTEHKHNEGPYDSVAEHLLVSLFVLVLVLVFGVIIRCWVREVVQYDLK
jgi:Ca2+/Na+ antiporter